MASIPFTYYSLWGYVKNRVYAQEIRDMDDLKEKIREAFRSINHATLGKVFDEFKRRLRDCELLNGGKVEVCRKRQCANCNRP